MSRLVEVCAWSGPLRGSVVFVHGLGGNAYDTWRRDADSFWPLWLGREVEGLAVYTLAYDAPPSGWLGTAMPLQDRVVNVLETLLAEPRLRRGPVAFICHSLGGLIVKQLLLDLQQQQSRRPEAADLLSRIHQIVFIATPHTGSRQGTLLDRLRFIAQPTAIARVLVDNDPTLRAINNDYRGLADERRDVLRHRIYYETAGTPAGVIVDEASADPGLPGDPPVPIDADHLSIVKPRDRGSLLYLRIRDFIAQTPLAETTPPRVFETFVLPPIRSETPRNIVPNLVRIGVIGLVALIAYKGVQSVLAPTPIVSKAEFDSTRRQSEDTHALVKEIAARLTVNRATAASAPNEAATVEAAVAASVEGAARGDAQMQQALELLRSNRVADAEAIFREVAQTREAASVEARKIAAEKARAGQDSARQAAAAYRNLGAIAGLRDLKAGRDAYAKAVALDPENTTGLLWNGWFQLQSGNLAEAEKSLRALLAPERTGAAAVERFWARIGLGSVDELRGDVADALTQYGEAGEELSHLSSASAQGVADAETKQTVDVGRYVVAQKTGAALARQLKFGEASAAYRSALDIALRYASHAPQDVTWRVALAMSHMAIGHAALAAKDYDEARGQFREGLSVTKDLAQADPANVAYQSSIAAFEESLGDALAAEGKPLEAAQAYAAALEAAQQLAQADIENHTLQIGVATLFGKIGDVEAAQNRYEDASAHYRQSHAIVERLAKADWSNTDQRAKLSMSYMRMAVNEVLAKRPQTAIESLVKGRNIVAGLSAEHPDDGAWKAQLATFDKTIAFQKAALAGDEPRASGRKEKPRRRH